MWLCKGSSFAELGLHEEAIECYDEAIAINPQYLEAWYNKGNSLAEGLGRHEEAIECYDEAIAINSHFKDVCTTRELA